MLGLPVATELRRIITKKRIFEHFGAEMNPDRRKRFDGEIARITVVNEVSSASVNIPDGETVHAFFVLLIQLRRKDFDQQNVAFVAKLFGQKLLMVLEAEGQQRLALWQMRLIMSEWTRPEALNVELSGLNLDQVWARIVTSIAGIQLDTQSTLDEQLELSAQRKKLTKAIARLEKQAWVERQPKRKMEILQGINRLHRELEGL